MCCKHLSTALKGFPIQEKTHRKIYFYEKVCFLLLTDYSAKRILAIK